MCYGEKVPAQGLFPFFLEIFGGFILRYSSPGTAVAFAIPAWSPLMDLSRIKDTLVIFVAWIILYYQFLFSLS